jgi:hypothetical protein
MILPVLSGSKWASSGSTTSITWSFGASDIASLTSSYSGYDQFDSYIPTAYRALVEKAFDAWEAVANVDFIEVADGASVDIRVGNNAIDGSGSTVGTTQSWSSRNLYKASEVYFDTDAYGSIFYAVAVHEIGHAIGLDHSPLMNAVMYASINTANRSGTLSSDDIQGIQQIYGAHISASASVATAATNILRPVGDAAATDIVAKAAAGTITAATAIGQIVQLADGDHLGGHASATSSSPARIPSKAGIDYLVSHHGRQRQQYQLAPTTRTFNIENRYINFAVNLGANGEGKAAFLAAYGGLSLLAATSKAYTTIFGGVPTDAKVHALIDTRVDYFAAYGGDGPAGIGTKAAMVGWLLAEATKADVGMYAHANNAFLTDLADGATFAVDLVAVYGKAEYAFAG